VGEGGGEKTVSGRTFEILHRGSRETSGLPRRCGYKGKVIRPKVLGRMRRGRKGSSLLSSRVSLAWPNRRGAIYEGKELKWQTREEEITKRQHAVGHLLRSDLCPGDWPDLGGKGANRKDAHLTPSGNRHRATWQKIGGSEGEGRSLKKPRRGKEGKSGGGESLPRPLGATEELGAQPEGGSVGRQKRKKKQDN